MKTKRIFSLALATALCLSATACAGKFGTTTTSSAASSGGASDPNAVDHVTLMVKAKPTHGDWNKFWLLDEIEKDCKIRLDVTQVSEDGWEEKKNLAFATNSLPDVFIGGSGIGLDSTDLATYGAQGIVLPLDEYITAENMPNVFEQVKDYPDLISGMTFPDGHIYSFVGVDGSTREYAKSRFWINKTWAETLKVKVPTNLDEYYTYLKAIKEGDPNGNGQHDEIPISGQYINGKDRYYDDMIPILVAFGFTERRYEAKNNKVIYVPTDPVYKEFLTYMNKLWTEGLIDSEYFTMTTDQRKAKLAQGLVGTFTDHANWLDIPKQEIYDQYSCIEPMISKYNSKKIWPAHEALLYGGFSITKNVTNKALVAKLMKFCDWTYSTDGTMDIWRGPEVGTWSEHSDWGWKMEKSDSGILKRNYFFPSSYESKTAFMADKVEPENGYFPYAPVASRTDPADPTSQSGSLSTNIINNLAPYYHTGWPRNIKFTPEESNEFSLLDTDLESYVQQMEAKFITGEVPISEFDNFVKSCKDRNVARYLTILQTAYDRWNSTNK